MKLRACRIVYERVVKFRIIPSEAFEWCGDVLAQWAVQLRAGFSSKVKNDEDIGLVRRLAASAARRNDSRVDKSYLSDMSEALALKREARAVAFNSIVHD